MTQSAFRLFSLGQFCLQLKLVTLLIIALLSGIAVAAVDPGDLDQQTRIRMSKVAEFAFIQAVAEDLGVDIYLFGGTAAAFGHYVRWDIERESGDSKYQKERFDYDYTNIYRGNQDLDIVVDGSAEQISDVRKRLQKEYPHFEGSKESWDVRSLRVQIGDRLPLLDNSDFLNQHTDSNSVGMIKVNASEEDPFVYRSLLDWDNPRSEFLLDIAKARVRYIFNPNHETTSMFEKGMNPPVLSAIRYIAKVVQYEVTPEEGDIERITGLVASTDWNDLSSYAKKRLAKFGLKALLNAPNSEYAWNLLDSTGFRKSLIEMDGNRINSNESLSWWMNKEPLRSKEFGTSGVTGADIAKELGVDQVIVAHETKSFQAYDNITRSSRGAANAFISRDGVSGEAASWGDGFYTKIGESGARATNLTIRFVLNSKAREGVDFIRKYSLIIVKNKNALSLIQDNLNLTLLEFLKLLYSGDIGQKDEGLKVKFLRKFSRTVKKEDEEFREAVDWIKTVTYSDIYPLENVPPIEKDIKYMVDFVTSNRIKNWHVEQVLPALKKSGKNPDSWPLLRRSLTDNVQIDRIFEEVLPLEYWVEHQDLEVFLLKEDSLSQLYPSLVKKTLIHKNWAKKEKLLKKVLHSGTADYELIRYIYSNLKYQVNPDHVDLLVQRGRNDPELVKFVLSRYEMRQDPRWAGWIETILDRSQGEKEIIQYIVGPEYTDLNSKWLHKIYQKECCQLEIVKFVLSQPHWVSEVDLAESVLQSNKPNYELLRSYSAHVLGKSFWSRHPKLLGNYLKILNEIEVKPESDISEAHRDELWAELALFVLSRDFWRGSIEEVWRYMRREKLERLAAEYIIKLGDRNFNSARGSWNSLIATLSPEVDLKQISEDKFLPNELWGFLQKAFQRLATSNNQRIVYTFKRFFYSNPHWVNYPQIISLFSATNSHYTDFNDVFKILQPDHWLAHPELFVENVVRCANLDNRQRQGKCVDTIINTFNLPESLPWREHLELIRFLEGAELTVPNLIEKATGEQPFEDWLKQNRLRAEPDIGERNCSQQLRRSK